MTRSKLLTIEALIDELDMGKATLKFILHRFSPWFETQIVNDETCYTEQAVTTLLKIRKFLDTGMLPEQIEASLAQEAQMLKAVAHGQPPAKNQDSFPVDMESASLFKDMLQVFIEKQDRIASAQEALTRVEERKADAMEKRAAAEEKKADAMTNIAMALQEMNQRHGAPPQAMEIAGRAVETLALEEADALEESLLDTGFDETEHLLEDPAPTADAFEDQAHGDPGDTVSSNMDDLSCLVNETALTLEEIDDLSSLIDSVSAPKSDLDNLESLLDEPSSPETTSASDDMDDLSKLVAPDLPLPNDSDKAEDLDDLYSLVGMDANTQEGTGEDLDDLSRLVDEPAGGMAAVDDLDDLSALVKDLPASQVPSSSGAPMDDLSKLIGSSGDAHADSLDDLSALIEEPDQSQPQSQAAMDDLSLLVGGTTENSEQVPQKDAAGTDDLWALLPDSNSSTRQTQASGDEQSAHTGEMDNLSALLSDAPDSSGGEGPVQTGTAEEKIKADSQNSSKETPSIKPDISPDQDKGKYKAAVMKIIIELKGQGLTAQQTTDRLNGDGVATLSGKPAWGVKAIEKIYGFIDSAK